MSPIQILVVEDETLVAEDLRETLELLGFAVPYVTVSGENAIAHLERSLQSHAQLPNLVLMDIQLAGGMDGIEASHIIQHHYHLPVVYLTANADLSTLERVKGSQPFGYILKPFNERTLATTIDIALTRHQAEQSIHTTLQTMQAEHSQTESLLQQKSNYLYMVAHELRNPLTAIKFASEILKKSNDNLAAEQRDRYIQRIYAATKNLNDLLDDVLLFERSATQGEQRLTLRPILLSSIWHELLETFQLTAGETHQFQFTSTGQEVVLHLDEKLLWHLFSNLVSNAVKYSPEGGTITIALNWSDKDVQISITDCGIGISPDLLPRLFEPFQRGLNVGGIPGTGLGLAIVKRCVELQGGTIRVDSQMGQGTTFQVTFAIAACPEASA